MYLRGGPTSVTVVTENKRGKIGKTEMIDMQLHMRLIQANSLAAEGWLKKPVLFSKESPAEQLNSTQHLSVALEDNKLCPTSWQVA